MMPGHGTDTSGTHHQYIRDIDFTHKNEAFNMNKWVSDMAMLLPKLKCPCNIGLMPCVLAGL